MGQTSLRSPRSPARSSSRSRRRRIPGAHRRAGRLGKVACCSPHLRAASDPSWVCAQTLSKAVAMVDSDKTAARCCRPTGSRGCARWLRSARGRGALRAMTCPMKSPKSLACRSAFLATLTSRTTDVACDLRYASRPRWPRAARPPYALARRGTSPASVRRVARRPQSENTENRAGHDRVRVRRSSGPASLPLSGWMLGNSIHARLAMPPGPAEGRGASNRSGGLQFVAVARTTVGFGHGVGGATTGLRYGVSRTPVGVRHGVSGASVGLGP